MRKNNLLLATLMAFFLFTPPAQAALAQVPKAADIFPDMHPSKKGRPIKQTFFHRGKVQAPVFLEVLEAGSPNALAFAIRLYPTDLSALPPKPQEDAFSNGETYKAAQATHREALRSLYTDQDRCPQIGTMSFSHNGGDMSLYFFQVCLPYRGKSYGTHALVTALSILKSKAQGFNDFVLSVRKEEEYTQRLIGFYQRLGFQEDNESFMALVVQGTMQSMRMPKSAFNPHSHLIFGGK